jgi:hypothetical protein
MGKKKPELEHAIDEETGSHEKTSGDDGACLTSHVSEYEDKNSCSHRFQAYRHALEYKHWYDYPAYERLQNSPALTPSERPKGISWNLEASQSWSIGPVPNFRMLACAPYMHNAHHILPRSVLNGCLLDAAKTDMRLHWIVRMRLLDAKYNLNDKENMVILPMRKVIADGMGLPRHISQIDAEPGVIPERCDHSVYSSNVEARVKPVITNFADQLDMKEHDVKATAFAKASLVEISQSLFMQLRAWGAVAKGQALNAMPPSLFS